MVRNRATIVGSMTVTLLLMETTAEIILEARPVAVMQPEMTPAMEQATATVMVPLPPASSASRMRPKVIGSSRSMMLTTMATRIAMVAE